MSLQINTPDDFETVDASDLLTSFHPAIEDGTLEGPSNYPTQRQTTLAPLATMTGMHTTRPKPVRFSGLRSSDLATRLATRFSNSVNHDFYSDRLALSPEERDELFYLEGERDHYSDRFALSDYEEEDPKKVYQARKPKAKVTDVEIKSKKERKKAPRGRKPKSKVPEVDSKEEERPKDTKDERIQLLELELERLRRRIQPDKRDEESQSRRGRKPEVKTIEAVFATLQHQLPLSESEEEEPKPARPRRGHKPKLEPIVELGDEEVSEEEHRRAPATCRRKRKAIELEEVEEGEQLQPVCKSRRSCSKTDYAEESE